MGYAFISYSTKNQSVADAVRTLFAKQNIDTWMAPYDIPAGKQYAAAITKAIRECSCFVLLLSNASQASVAVDSEVELAVLKFNKPIITIELEEVALNDAFTFYIHNKQIIPVRRIDERSHEMQQILDTVKVYTQEQQSEESKISEANDLPNESCNMTAREETPVQAASRTLKGMQDLANVLRILSK